MVSKPITRRSALGLSAAALSSLLFAGCTSETADGRVEVEIVSYKQEAKALFDQIQADFNASHDNIVLKIDSPADAVTIMKTRFVRENYPDVIGIGGDGDYANFVDSNILADVLGYEGLTNVKQSYTDILKSVTYVPMDGIYGVPYVANAAGMLYNIDMFEEHGWQIPETWDELIDLCEEIKAEGEVAPFYLGYLDTWTILSPWNSITVNMVPSDLAREVNAGSAKFADYYGEPARRMRQMLQYSQTCLPGEPGPFAASYNDACTSFANGKSAMYPCGSFAVPQIMTGNDAINVGMFAMPSADNPADRIVVSGVDLQWCVAETCPHKDEVLRTCRPTSPTSAPFPARRATLSSIRSSTVSRSFWTRGACSTTSTIPTSPPWRSTPSCRRCCSTSAMTTPPSPPSSRSSTPTGCATTARSSARSKSTRASSKGDKQWQVLARAKSARAA